MKRKAFPMQRPGLFLLVSSCLLLPEAPSASGAVIFQAFERPLAPGIHQKEGSQQQVSFEGKAVTFQWKLAPYPVDLDGNGMRDLTIVHNIEPAVATHRMNVSLTGQNQIWAIARGITGNYFGSYPRSMVAGTEIIGPSLFSDNPRVGWRNDDELVDPSDLDGVFSSIDASL